MFEQPLIIVLVVLAVLGVGIGVFSLRRRRRVRRLCLEAGQAIEQGRHDDAQRMLLAAERGWTFNSHDGSRSSCLADLNDFTAIVGLLARLPRDDASCVASVEAATAELRTLLADRGGFGSDGRSMKREDAVGWAELSDRFKMLR